MLKLGNAEGALFNASFVGAAGVLGVEARFFVHHATHGATFFRSCAHPPVATTPQGVGEKSEGDGEHPRYVFVRVNPLNEYDVQVVRQKHHEQKA